ncbi:phosphatase PAP2 family protein [Roseibium salinum]|uniref:Phosphatase PAP2 family protein n=1 Tax=Roseibium salinum TaxID=1604349 RepID=A0ABT3R7B2_9HYPH|nr:phosphatase PAP2 family protein [Roseibium sp. DSM 29163]MCX2725023.1 phosphatase PAP2 family protein [Roseibium sp. DSM 29163]
MSEARSSQNSVKSAPRKVAVWCIDHPITAVSLYICVVSLFFLAFPRVDFWASGLFHSAASGFAAENVPFLRDVRHLGPFLVRVIAITCLAVLLAKLLVPERGPLMPLRMPVFLLTTLILGPGILVNSILKDNWGRPRPRSVEEFGGDLPFQPVWKITDHCDSNCSFVSGEASASMWLVSVAFLVPPTWRKAVLAFVLPLCLILSVNRIAFGGHFLSDTLLSWGLTLLLVLVVYRLLYVKDPPLVSDRQLDAWFTVSGRRLQDAFQRVSVWIRQGWRGVVRIFSEH